MEYSIYLHIPFCRHRCHYCDFNTFAGMERYIPEYIDALIKEFRIVINQKPNLKINSIYFGGGTPSLIPSQLYKALFSELKQLVSLSDDCEISLEANPGTLDLPYLAKLREIGFNRISLGAQSTDTFDLVRLDRIHSIEDILSSVQNARKAGFDNINLDMIFGLPWQDLESWENSLHHAITIKPEHFSLYSLIIEPGTPLFSWYQRGLIAPQDQDREADMYELAMDLLEKAGYKHYEISNWALKDPDTDFSCRHNQQYWLNQPYFGFGAGAHGYVNQIRSVNTSLIPEYIQRVNLAENKDCDYPCSPSTVSAEIIDKSTQMRDFMMLGLRLVGEGVCSKRFEERYGQSMQEVFDREINKLLSQGLVEWWNDDETCLRLSKRGIMVANQVFIEFV
jgi:oxygen-independent coproporphyrinogen-3 oxidase